jgi:glycosyltransferase involved in cell wall biosynthesis
MAGGELRLVYAGALSPIYELDVVLAALARLRAARPGLPVRLDLYGRDFAEVPLDRLAAELGLADQVRSHGRVPIEAVPAAIAEADIGLAPTRRSEFTDFSLSTKLFEYAAMDKPVVASALPLVQRTFPAGTVATYPPGDAAALAQAILSLVDDPVARDAGVVATRERIRAMAWEHEAEAYLTLIDRLTGEGATPADPVA